MLGDELKSKREARGLAVTKLAQLSGVSRQHIYAIEANQNNQPNTSTLNKLARGLSGWRDEQPDDAEAAVIFRELQEAAGYPVEQIQTVDGEIYASPVPAAIAGPMQNILENWSRCGQSERDVVAKLLKVASELGAGPPDTMGQNGPLDSVEQNQTDSSENKQQTLLALYLDWLMAQQRRIGQMTDAPVHRVPPRPRELALAGAYR